MFLIIKYIAVLSHMLGDFMALLKFHCLCFFKNYNIRDLTFKLEILLLRLNHDLNRQ